MNGGAVHILKTIYKLSNSFPPRESWFQIQRFLGSCHHFPSFTIIIIRNQNSI